MSEVLRASFLLFELSLQSFFPFGFATYIFRDSPLINMIILSFFPPYIYLYCIDRTLQLSNYILLIRDGAAAVSGLEILFVDRVGSFLLDSGLFSWLLHLGGMLANALSQCYPGLGLDAIGEGLRDDLKEVGQMVPSFALWSDGPIVSVVHLGDTIQESIGGTIWT